MFKESTGILDLPTNQQYLEDQQTNMQESFQVKKENKQSLNNKKTNPLANNVRFITRHIFCEIQREICQIPNSQQAQKHIHVLKNNRKKKRADQKIEINYNSIDLYFLCGYFTQENNNRLKTSEKDCQAYENILKLHLNSFQKVNETTTVLRKIVLEFLTNKSRFHSVIQSAKKYKEDYDTEKYDMIRKQIIYSIKQGEQGIIITNIQSEKKLNVNQDFGNQFRSNQNFPEGGLSGDIQKFNNLEKQLNNNSNFNFLNNIKTELNQEIQNLQTNQQFPLTQTDNSNNNNLNNKLLEINQITLNNYNQNNNNNSLQTILNSNISNNINQNSQQQQQQQQLQQPKDLNYFSALKEQKKEENLIQATCNQCLQKDISIQLLQKQVSDLQIQEKLLHQQIQADKSKHQQISNQLQIQKIQTQELEFKLKQFTLDNNKFIKLPSNCQEIFQKISSEIPENFMTNYLFKSETKKDKLFNALIFQSQQFFDSLKSAKIYTELMKEMPILQTIKNLNNQIIANQTLEEFEVNIQIQNKLKSEEDIETNELSLHDDTLYGGDQLTSANSTTLNIPSDKLSFQKLNLEFHRYQQEFKEIVLKQEQENLVSKFNKDVVKYTRALKQRSLGKILEKMGKYQKSAQIYIQSIQLYLIASLNQVDSQIIYWAFESSKIVSLIKDKQLIAQLAQQIDIIYQEVQKSQPLAPTQPSPLFTMNLYFIALSYSLIDYKDQAILILKQILNIFNNQHEALILKTISKIYLEQKSDYLAGSYALKYFQSIQKSYIKNDPIFLQALVFLKQVQNQITDDQQLKIINESYLQESYNNLGGSFAQCLSFSNLCMENQLYKNAIYYRKESSKYTTNQNEIAVLQQDIAYLLFKNQEFQESFQIYQNLINHFNSQQINFDKNFVQMKIAIFLSYQIEILKKQNQKVLALQKEQEFQKIICKCLGAYDIQIIEVLRDIDHYFCNLVCGEQYFGKDVIINNLNLDQEKIQFLQNEVLECLVSIYNRQYIEEVNSIVQSRNISILQSTNNNNNQSNQILM